MDREPSMESLQEKLKQKLVSGTIAHGAFLDELRSLDQSTPDRNHAYKNLEVLTAPEVVEVFEKSEESSSYQNLLSLTYFHIGQTEAIDGTGDPLSYFESALEADKKVGWEGYEENIHYIEATIAYFEKDLPRLEKTFEQMKAGINKNVVSNLIKGLKNRGDVNYKEDYNSD